MAKQAKPSQVRDYFFFLKKKVLTSRIQLKRASDYEVNEPDRDSNEGHSRYARIVTSQDGRGTQRLKAPESKSRHARLPRNN